MISLFLSAPQEPRVELGREREREEMVIHMYCRSKGSVGVSPTFHPWFVGGWQGIVFPE